MGLSELKQKYNLNELELFNQDLTNLKVSFEANKLKQTNSSNISGYAIRLAKNNKIGFCASYGTNNVEELLNQAIDLSTYSEEVKFKLPTNNKACKKTLSEKREYKFDNKDLINGFKETGNNIVETIISKAGSVLVDISFEADQISEFLENSNELFIPYKKDLYSTAITIRDTSEGNFTEISTAFIEEKNSDCSFLVNELIEFFNLSKSTSKIKSGKYPVLFTSKATKELIPIIELALNGKEVLKKSSPWKDKIGKKVLSEKITIEQNPAFGYMARDFDHEGIEIQKLILVKEGILNNFYFDLVSGVKMKPFFKSTGNGFKPSLSSQIEPQLLNLVFPFGKRKISEIVKDIKYGLFVDQTMGALSSDISGDISLNIEFGCLIENGEIKGRVKDTMISGNVYEVLNNVIEFSDTCKWYWSNIYSPDMLLDGFTVASK